MRLLLPARDMHYAGHQPFLQQSDINVGSLQDSTLLNCTLSSSMKCGTTRLVPVFIYEVSHMKRVIYYLSDLHLHRKIKCKACKRKKNTRFYICIHQNMLDLKNHVTEAGNAIMFLKQGVVPYSHLACLTGIDTSFPPIFPQGIFLSQSPKFLLTRAGNQGGVHPASCSQILGTKLI